MLVTLLAMAVNVVGDFTLGLAFGIAGLAASTSLSLVLAAVANTWFLGRHHGVVGFRSMSGMVARTAVAALAGAVVGAVVLRIVAAIVQPGLSR